ncbi:MAG: hypothetical protein LN408_03335 [Candidatus Thermoplasmatota archaeon]|nr:hypothetical protein [Candidatus Thermoplasmatota archaeon]
MKIEWHETAGKWRLEDNFLVIAFDEIKMDNSNAIQLLNNDRSEFPFYLGSIMLGNMKKSEFYCLLDQIIER